MIEEIEEGKVGRKERGGEILVGDRKRKVE